MHVRVRHAGAHHPDDRREVAGGDPLRCRSDDVSGGDGPGDRTGRAAWNRVASPSARTASADICCDFGARVSRRTGRPSRRALARAFASQSDGTTAEASRSASDSPRRGVTDPLAIGRALAHDRHGSGHDPSHQGRAWSIPHGSIRYMRVGHRPSQWNTLAKYLSSSRRGGRRLTSFSVLTSTSRACCRSPNGSPSQRPGRGCSRLSGLGWRRRRSSTGSARR